MQTYAVTLKRWNKNQTVAGSHGFEINLGARTGQKEFGFNAAEALLAALGNCIMTNINTLAPKMRIEFQELMLLVAGERQDKPPKISKITIQVSYLSSSSDAHIKRLFDLCMKNGTVTNTLIGNTEISISLNKKIEIKI